MRCAGQFLTGHTGNMFAVGFFPDRDDFALTGAADGTCRMLSLERGEDSALCGVWTHHGGYVHEIVSVAPFCFLSVGGDGRLHRVDVRCREREQPPHDALVRWPEGRLLSASVNPQAPCLVALGGQGRSVRVFDLRKSAPTPTSKTGRLVRDSHANLRACVAELPTGDTGTAISGVRWGVRGRRLVATVLGGRVSVFDGSSLLSHCPFEEATPASGSAFSSAVEPLSEDPKQSLSHWNLHWLESDHRLLEADIASLGMSPPSHSWVQSIMQSLRGEASSEATEATRAADLRRREAWSDAGGLLAPRVEKPCFPPLRGALSLRTCKEAAFLGDADDIVVAGSEGGLILAWRLDALRGFARPLGAFVADSTIVNVVEPVPEAFSPTMGFGLVSSGIDSDLKYWSVGEIGRISPPPEVVPASHDPHWAEEAASVAEAASGDRRMAVARALGVFSDFEHHQHPQGRRRMLESTNETWPLFPLASRPDRPLLGPAGPAAVVAAAAMDGLRIAASNEAQALPPLRRFREQDMGQCLSTVALRSRVLVNELRTASSGAGTSPSARIIRFMQLIRLARQRQSEL
jgi:hypothetical protein